MEEPPAARVEAATAAVLVEVDSCLFDLHRDGHRVAFVEALEKEGVPSGPLKPQLYADILRKGGGTAEGMLAVYLSVVGWPVEGQERKEFVEHLHNLKAEAFAKMILERRVPLRQGATAFLHELASDNVRIGLVPATASHPAEGVALAALDAIAEACGADVANATAIVGGFPTGDSYDEHDDPQDDPALDLERALSAEAARRKAEAALSAVAQLKGVSHVDAGLLAAMRGGGAENAVDEGALAVTANLVLGVGVGATAYVGALAGSAAKAKQAGLLPVILRTSASARAQFSRSAAAGVFDGFGAGGGLTWRRLKPMVDRHGGSERAS